MEEGGDKFNTKLLPFFKRIRKQVNASSHHHGHFSYLQLSRNALVSMSDPSFRSSVVAFNWTDGDAKGRTRRDPTPEPCTWHNYWKHDYFLLHQRNTWFDIGLFTTRDSNSNCGKCDVRPLLDTEPLSQYHLILRKLYRRSVPRPLIVLETWLRLVVESRHGSNDWYLE